MMTGTNISGARFMRAPQPVKKVQGIVKGRNP